MLGPLLARSGLPACGDVLRGAGLRECRLREVDLEPDLETIFVLEGEEPLWSEDELVDDFLRPELRARLDEWRKLADVRTWPAQPIFWEASADQ